VANRYGAKEIVTCAKTAESCTFCVNKLPLLAAAQTPPAAIEMEVYEGEKIVQGYVVGHEMQEAVVIPQAASVRGGGAIHAGRANTDGAGTMARPDTLRRSHLGPFSQRGLVRVRVDGFPLVRDAPGC
jgi:hypothetical protein